MTTPRPQDQGDQPQDQHGEPSEPAGRHLDAAISRRTLIGAGGAFSMAGLAAVLGAAPDVPAVAAGESLRMAVLTDTHVNLQSPASTGYLERVFAGMAARDPQAVLHCGDITDTGLAEQLEVAGAVVPPQLRGLLHYAPGNHEVRWDTSAKEELHEHLGARSYSFDVAGVHLIAYDPTQVLQEPGHYGRDGLAWLEADLAAVDGDRPVLLFQHYPVGGDYYYIDDQDAVVDLLTEHRVTGIFAGHVHRETLSRTDGLTQVTMAAVKNGATYYWVEAQGQQLVVSRVDVAEDGTETATAVVDIDLADRPRRAPRRIGVGDVVDGVLPLTVRAPGATEVATARYAQTVYGGTAATTWDALATTGGVWRGGLDVSSVPPGRQRARVRATTADGSWEETVRYRVPNVPGTPRVVWERRLPAAVQGGLLQVGSTVVAATTDGTVSALAERDGSLRWQTRPGGQVFRRPTLHQDLLLLPGADHRLRALGAADGRERWSLDLGAPVCCEVHLAGDLAVVAAGEDLVAVDTTTAEEVWRVPGRGFFAGRVDSDDEAVYSCATDGLARAHRLSDGSELWSFRMRSGPVHTVTLYSGWNTKVLAHDGVVVVASVSTTWGLDAADGAVLWTRPGSTMYAGPTPLSGTEVVLATEFGVVSRVDVTDGTARWDAEVGARVFEAGTAVLDDHLAVQTSDGQLVALSGADGTETGRLQHSLAYCFGPVTTTESGLVVVGDQDGMVRALDVTG